jgi:hypothetical protein
MCSAGSSFALQQGKKSNEKDPYDPFSDREIGKEEIKKLKSLRSKH